MKNVVITGCSTGFGKATALALARRGERVFATMRNPAAGADLIDAARADGLALSVHRIDVTDQRSIDSGIAEITAHGPIDALVNNAGRGLRGPITTLSDEEIHALFDVNVYGVLRMVRACAPGMRDRRRGTIVNVTSMAGIVGVPFEAGYGASKHAVEAMAEAMRWELSPYGIDVVVIEPGAHATEFFSSAPATSAFPGDHPERPMFDFFSTAIERTMLGDRLQDPGMVAAAIADAVTEPGGPFRRLVGRDATTVVGLHQASTYEEYEKAIQDLFGLHDAPTIAGRA